VDLILLDVLMPNMDGFEVCRQLKAHKETREIPVIFMTLLDETVEKVRGFELGAVDYITKPFQAKEVLARVKTHLTLRNLQRQLQIANEKLVHQLQKSECLNAELQKRNEEIQEALSTIKTLSGLVPICAWCHKTIRNEDGEWVNLETYIENHSEAKFTHGVCIACLKKLGQEG
jgi:DNA-binding response OmpR family regulator